jgi:hypothetical protein
MCIPEKRKVGGSTPPLTTSSDQVERLAGLVRLGRLTATATATAASIAIGLRERVAQLGECLAFFVERGVRVDRYRDLNVAVTDDVPDHVRSDA